MPPIVTTNKVTNCQGPRAADRRCRAVAAGAVARRSSALHPYPPPAAPVYPVLPTQPVGASYSAAPAYQQTYPTAPPPPSYQQNAQSATVPDDPPPAYQPNAPQQQQNTVWVYKN